MDRRSFLALAAVLLAAQRAAADGAKKLYLQPLGAALPDADVDMVKRALAAFYVLDVTLLPRVPLPKRAYYAPRHRYRAEKLLEFLVERAPDDAFRVLGLTAVDISTTKGDVKDWGILGLATIDGRVGVLSSLRCKKKARSAVHARQRLGKVAVHETGHTLGLEHCPNLGCLMEDAEGSVLTCDREYDLCSECRMKVVRAGHALAEGGTIPWPQP